MGAALAPPILGFLTNRDPLTKRNYKTSVGQMGASLTPHPLTNVGLLWHEYIVNVMFFRNNIMIR